MHVAGKQTFTGTSDDVLHRLLQRALAALFLLLVFQGFTHARDQTDFLLIVLSLIGFIILCIPVFIRQTYQVFEPYSLALAIFLMGYSVKLVYIVSAENRSYIDEIMLGRSLDFLVKPALILMVGFIFLVVGYLIKHPSRRLKRTSLLKSRGWRSGRLFQLAFLLFGCSIVFFFIYAKQVGIDFSNLASLSTKRFVETDGAPMARDTKFYFKWVASWSRPAFYLLLTWWLTGPSKASRTILIPLLAATGFMALFLPFTTSSRTPMVFFILDVIIISYYLRLDRRIWQFMLRTAGVAGAGLFLFILVFALRANREDTFRLNLSIDDVLSHVVGAPYLADITKTAHIMEAVPQEIPRQYGKSYLTVIFAPIPRSMWPEKPSIGMGPMIGERVYGRTRSGIPPGFAAEAYINFSILGVWLSFFLFGFGIKAVYARLAPYLHTRNGILLYVAFLRIPVVVIGMDFTVALVQFLLEMVPMVLFLYYISLNSEGRGFSIWHRDQTTRRRGAPASLPPAALPSTNARP
ncbi:MAG: oligosaccharide repeat unit polymerase [Kiritimatiellia bacterium]|jgi:oligosaccharide repeat unit polymerase